MVHNHPSGNPNCSKKDLELTKKIEEGANLLELKMLDHIIIGDGTFQSIFTNRIQKIKDKE